MFTFSQYQPGQDVQRIKPWFVYHIYVQILFSLSMFEVVGFVFLVSAVSVLLKINIVSHNSINKI